MEKKKETILEATRGLLSALMNTNSEAFVERVFENVFVDDFPIPGYDAVYRALRAAHDNTKGEDRSPAMIIDQAGKIRIDSGGVLLDDMLSAGIDKRDLESIKLLGVLDPSGIQYMETVAQYALRQRIRDVGVKLHNLSGEDVENVAKVAEDMFDRAMSRSYRSNTVSIKSDAIAIWNAVSGKEPFKFSRIKTRSGFWDKHLNGLYSNKLYYLAGLQHHGKTQLLYSICSRACLYENAVWIHFPMDGPSTVSLNLMAMMTGQHVPWVLDRGDHPIPEPTDRESVAPDKILEMGNKDREEEPSRKQMIELRNAMEVLSSLDIFKEVGARSPAEMRAAVKRIVRKYPGRFVIASADYLQVVSGDRPNQEEYARISNAARSLRESVDDDMDNRGCWIMLSQFSRNGSNGINNMEPDDWPGDIFSVQSMKGASDIEQSADAIVYTLMPFNIMSGPQRIAEKDMKEVRISVVKNKITNNLGDTQGWMQPGSGVVFDTH